MFNYKAVRAASKKLSEHNKEVSSMNDAITKRGRATFKIPVLSDKKTGEMMEVREHMKNRTEGLTKEHKKHKDAFVHDMKVGGGVATGVLAAGLAGKAIHSTLKKNKAKKESELNKTASALEAAKKYGKRAASSLRDVGSRAFASKGELDHSIKKTKKELTDGLKGARSNKKPANLDHAELGHLNAKLTKDIDAKKKHSPVAKIRDTAVGLAILGGAGAYANKKWSENAQYTTPSSMF